MGALEEINNFRYISLNTSFFLYFQKCHDSAFGIDEKRSLTRRTFARTQPSTAKVSKSIMSVLQYYKWKR